MEVQYFGASSLQIKISRFWHEIPADNYAFFREKLIDAVMFYANGPKIVLTRLCLAVSEMSNLLSLYKCHKIYFVCWKKAVVHDIALHS